MLGNGAPRVEPGYSAREPGSPAPAPPTLPAAGCGGGGSPKEGAERDMIKALRDAALRQGQDLVAFGMEEKKEGEMEEKAPLAQEERFAKIEGGLAS